MNISNEKDEITANASRWGVGIALAGFVEKALFEKAITIYEAFQLMEISGRLEHSGINMDYFSDDIVKSMNMALLAKLFSEEALYEYYCEETLKRRDVFHKELRKCNNGKLPKGKYYIVDYLEGILRAELEYMEMLSDKRAHTHRNSRKEYPYHWTCFPCDFFKYEDELIKVLKGEIDHYEIDKTISPEIIEMMTAIELRAIELE